MGQTKNKINMKNNKEILDEFGKLLIKDAFDNHISLTKNNLKDLRETERFKNLFQNMSNIQKIELENLSFEILSGFLFDLLNIFEENEEFKLIYEEKGQQVNLVEISDMLKAEAIIQNGWIERFSQYIKNGDNSPK